jgi:hypothetical protein
MTTVGGEGVVDDCGDGGGLDDCGDGGGLDGCGEAGGLDGCGAGGVVDDGTAATGAAEAGGGVIAAGVRLKSADDGGRVGFGGLGAMSRALSGFAEPPWVT